jgi:hypothetical protein
METANRTSFTKKAAELRDAKLFKRKLAMVAKTGPASNRSVNG